MMKQKKGKMMMKRGMLMIGALVTAFVAKADSYYWRATGDSANWNTTETNWAADGSTTDRIAFTSSSDAYVYFDGGDSATTVNINGSSMQLKDLYLNGNASGKTYTFNGNALSFSGWIDIYAGTFKFGTIPDVASYVRVRSGGAFDFYCTTEWEEKKRLIDKYVYLAGGTLKNSGTETVWFTPKQVVLEADSTVDGDAPISFYYLNNSNASITGPSVRR